MKKRTKLLFVYILTVVFSIVLISCSNTTNTDSKENKSSADSETADIYAKLNDLLKTADYPATVTTKTTKDGHTFTGVYAVTKNDGDYSVEYSYEKLSLFSFTDEGDVVAPEGFKTTCTGRIKVKDGKIVEKDGAETDISVEMLSAQGITLAETTLSDTKTENGIFTANVDSLKTVAGWDVATSAATIEITYTDVKITKIVLGYSTSSYYSEITYMFA